LKLPEILSKQNHYAALGQVYAVKLKYSKNRLFRQSHIINNEIGISSIGVDESSKFHHNNFINNNQQAISEGINYWDLDYPWGGNYWSDYIGDDLNNGLDQDQPGSDGIGDTPYLIPSGSSVDRYPLMAAYTPPTNIEIAKILFQSMQDGNEEIYVMDEDGSNQIRLTQNTASNGYPVWSPDNQKIAFVSNRTGDWEIFSMNTDGNVQTNLTRNPANDGYLSWSPDSQKIVFASDRDSLIPDLLDIYVMNADGTNVVRLTTNPAEDVHPAWSQDGQKIAFASDREANREIYVMNVDGTNVINLTNYGAAYDDYPAWSPDNTKIAFASDRDTHDSEKLDIYLMNADGSNVIRLTSNAVDDRHPAWSSDGSKIAFVSNRDGNREIYVMKADGSEVTRLTNQLGDDQHPSFSPPTSDYEGKLIKQIDDFKVYLIENGKKRHFTSPEALEWNGYSFSEVIEVSQEVLDSFEIAEDISITQVIINKYNDLAGEATFGTPAGTGENIGDPDSLGVVCSYVNFQNGAIEYFTNGDQAGNAYAILNPFFDKWASMGYTKSILGYPISDMSDIQTSSLGTPFKYQNFMNGTERGALEYNLSSGEVFEIHGAIYAKWEEKGFANGIMGLVTGDEKEAGKSPYGTTGRYSEFENGHIHWVSNIGDDNAGKIYRGKAFATYGDLDWLYTKEGGTNGKLGFPVMDKYETTTYGHGECVFEGGKIIWDDYRGLHEIIYHGYLPDLTITDISFSEDNPVEGEPIIIYATIKNVGYADAKGKINVTFSQQSYYEDFEADETGNKAYIDQYVIENGLNAEDKITAEITWNTAPVFSANPKGFINVEVDSFKEIEETNEYNNVGWGEVSITSRSNFKPEIDSYHFHNFQPTSTELEQMTLDYKNYLDVMANQHGAIAINLLSYGSGKAKEWLDWGKGSLAVCYGMSSTSKIYYDNPELKPSTAETFSMLKTDEEVKSNIIEYQSLQTPYLIIQTIRGFPKDVFGIGELNIKKEYNDIEKSIQSGQFPIINIKWYENNIFLGSHAVLAFNTYNTESKTIKNLLVYDPNNPGMARVIQFDLAGNKIIYESYNYGKEIHQTAQYESYYIPTLKYTDSVAQINNELQTMYKKIIEHLYKNKYTSLIFDCPINVTIIDQFGRSIDEYGTNDIPNAEINIIGDLKVFNIPTDLSYTVYINAYDSGKFTFTQINPLTSEYASLISFVEVPITENSIAISEVSSINPEYMIKIDYDGDGTIDEIIMPDIIDIVGANFYNITFLPPITTMDQFNLKDGSTLPIKFTPRNSTTDEFIYDDTVNVTITNSTGQLITDFTNGTGTDSVRINSTEEQYIVNFHTKDYDLNVGEYAITVTFGEPDSLRGYAIAHFALIDGTPPSPISNLHSTIGTTHINFTWTNPSDPDFNHTELYLNGTFLTNITAPQNYYNITGLLPDTSYELSTRTVDINGNINLTWVNDTASTLPASGTTLNLYTGWNLISLPLMPEDTSITSLLSPINGNYNIIWEYNASNTSDHWKKYDPGVPFGNDLTNMEPGKGYWIMMTSNNTLPISGTVPESIDIDLKTSWNLVAFNSLDSQPIAEALSSINGNYSIVWAYDASDTADHWKKYDPGVSFGNDLVNVEPGRGYWIMMTSEGILKI